MTVEEEEKEEEEEERRLDEITFSRRVGALVALGCRPLLEQAQVVRAVPNVPAPSCSICHPLLAPSIKVHSDFYSRECSRRQNGESLHGKAWHPKTIESRVLMFHMTNRSGEENLRLFQSVNQEYRTLL